MKKANQGISQRMGLLISARWKQLSRRSNLFCLYRYRLILSRGNLPTLDRGKYASAMGMAKAAYIFADADGSQLDVILIGTGSEMSFCVDAYEQLTPEGIKVSMVSKPSREFLENQEGIPG